MKLTKSQFKEMIRQAVRQQLDESSIAESKPVYIGSIKKGMAAGKAASKRSDPSYRSSKGETWEEELRRIRQQADVRHDMERRFRSAGKYWKKVFGDEAAVYYNNAMIDVGGPYRVSVKLEERDSFAGQVFVVSLLKSAKVIDSKEFGIGIGAKENIARFVKKMKKKLERGQMSEAQVRKSLKVLFEQTQGGVSLWAGVDGTSDNIYSLVKASSAQEALKIAEEEGVHGGGSHGGDSYQKIPDSVIDRLRNKVARKKAFIQKFEQSGGEGWSEWDLEEVKDDKRKIKSLESKLKMINSFIKSDKRAAGWRELGDIFSLELPLGESKTMKITKTQLQEMVRRAIREQLEERHGSLSPDGGMSQEELAKHLEQEREKKRRKDSNKKRQAAKQSARGMELECGPDMDREPRKLSVLFMDDDDRELGEGMYEAHGGGMDDFCAGYIEAALFSTTDESDESGGVPLDDNYGVEDIDEETLRKMQKDCDKFQELLSDEALDEVHSREEEAGRDFWFTRNGHGVGFWDGDWPEHETELDELSKKFGEVWLYVGDDGKIHQM